jgi:hypothetical protein
MWHLGSEKATVNFCKDALERRKAGFIGSKTGGSIHRFTIHSLFFEPPAAQLAREVLIYI